LQTLDELPLFEGSAFFDSFFDSFFDPYFNPLFVGFLPDACLSNVVEFEHPANLHTVEFVITAYQYFFDQFYDDIGPFEKTLANNLA
jgi:hypothetical protein